MRIVTIYPDLLGTYGDRGNGLVLARRAALRGLDVELLESSSDEPLPDAAIYCLGGGEDGPQQLAVERLERDGGLVRALGRGAVVLAVCAGLQILGRSFPGPHGERVEGLGLLGIDTVASAEPRAVGEVLVEAGDGLGTLTGFENHAGRTVLDEGVRALGAVALGVGNGDGRDGIISGTILGTYLHGPVLARNPVLADHLLASALGAAAPGAVPRGPAEVLHDERVEAARRR